ncbi:hypothetical protein HanIR_Chr05g0245141 [Helianthus annuus]|nr:hypothetical protein HanIR_Chr05g0245141 [Helianthus annuus]
MLELLFPCLLHIQVSALKMPNEWRAPPTPNRPIDRFIGILSSANHFFLNR